MYNTHISRLITVLIANILLNIDTLNVYGEMYALCKYTKLNDLIILAHPYNV